MKAFLPLLVAFFGFCLLPASSYAANPFLSAKDDKPVSANFRGTEWNDEYGSKEFPFGAKVVATRVATAPWGAVFRIDFTNIETKLENKREIGPLYFVVTDDEIGFLGDEDKQAAIQKLVADARPPTFDARDVYGISKGARKNSDTLTETTVTVKGNRCTYMWSHNSGHFTTVIWQKGAGLVEYAQGYGASKDGFRLKRVGAKK